MLGWSNVNDSSKILLVYVDPVTYPAAPPYGLEILSSFLLDKGYGVEIINPFQESIRPLRALKNRLSSQKYLFVGLSFRNWDEAGFSYKSRNPPSFIPHLFKVVSATREQLPQTPIIIGGAGFSISPERLLRNTGLNFGIKGPGEHSIIEFASCVQGSKTIGELKDLLFRKISDKQLQGFVLRRGNEIVYGPSQYEYLEPPFRFVDEGSHYSVKLLGGTIPVRTKIGCSQKCSYCVVPFIEPLKLRTFDGINNDLQFFIDRNEGHRFFFADSEFNLPSKDWFNGLLDQLVKNFRGRIGWMSYLYPTCDFTEEEGRKLALSGCRGVSFTVDSLEDRTLALMLKKYRSTHVLQMIEILLRHNIHVQVNLLFGGPGETYDTISSQVNLIKVIAKGGVTFSVNVGMRVYENTPLELISQKDKFKRHFYNTVQTPIFCSPTNHRELGRILRDELSRTPNVQFTEEHSRVVNQAMINLSLGARSLFANQMEKSEKYFIKSMNYNYESFRAKIGLARLYSTTNQIRKANGILKAIERYI